MAIRSPEMELATEHSTNWPRGPIAWLGLVGLVLLGVSQTFPIANEDLFWHLAIGEQMIDHGWLLDSDPLTTEAKGRDWVQHEWGAQLILAAIHRLGGLPALRILRGLLSILTMGLLGLILWPRARWPLAWLAGLIATWIVFEMFASMRPHMLGWVMLLWGVLSFLDRPTGWNAWRWLGFGVWMLVFINLHSSAVVVPVLCGVYTVELILRMAVERRWEWTKLRHWIGLSALASGMIFCQPAGFDLVPYMLKTHAINRDWSEEWQSLLSADVLQDNPQLVCAFGMLAVLGLWAVARHLRRPTAFPGCLLVLVAIGYGLAIRRMSFLIFLPLMLGLVCLRRPEQFRLLNRPLSQALVALVAIGLTVGWEFKRRSPVLSSAPIQAGLVPHAAIAFLAETQLQGRMLNPEDWGGMLSYYLYPAYKTLLDGRWVEVGRQVFEDSMAMAVRQRDPTALFERYQIDYLIQSRTDWERYPPLDPSNFLLAYRDNQAVIALRRTKVLADNLARICAYYATHPTQRPAPDPHRPLPLATDACAQ